MSIHFNLPDLITLNILGLQLCCEVPRCEDHSIPYSHIFGPRYLLQDPVLSLTPLSSLKVRDCVSQPYSTTGNVTVLHIFILKFLKGS